MMFIDEKSEFRGNFSVYKNNVDQLFSFSWFSLQKSYQISSTTRGIIGIHIFLDMIFFVSVIRTKSVWTRMNTYFFLTKSKFVESNMIKYLTMYFCPEFIKVKNDRNYEFETTWKRMLTKNQIKKTSLICILRNRTYRQVIDDRILHEATMREWYFFFTDE